MAEIRPIHRSVPLGGLKPRRMESTRMSAEESQFIERFALEIFTDCVNAGRTFQDAIAACYLSGLQNGIALSTPTPKEPK